MQTYKRIGGKESVDESWSTSQWVSLHRRLVISLVVVLLCIVVVFRVAVVGEWDDTGNLDYASLARNIIDGLLATVTVSFVIAVFFWWVGAPLRNTPFGGEIPPHSIGSNLNRATKTAQEWEYFGHIGRDARYRTLPVLGARSKAESLVISIRFVILDPANVSVCKAYADYRSRSRSSSLRPTHWDLETVQADLLATIICLIRAKARYPNFNVLLGLTPHFGLWRFDRSDEVVIVTQEDPQQPAYRYVRGSRFFAYHRLECDEAWKQSTQLAVTPRASGILSDSEVLDELKYLLGRTARPIEPLFARALEMARERTYYA
jgi:hypothetical protein